MVSRKYLCSAPHPSTWDARARALLKSLGGERKRRHEILKQTLSALSQIVEEKKRTGPGRKSNAEHALNFYRYVLNLEDDEDPDDEEEEEPPVTRKPRRRGRRGASERLAKRSEAELDDMEDMSEDDDDEEDVEVSVASMDSQEFFDQHNDLCEVCNVGGDLLCCSTCNLVFHLKCTRPVLKQLPSDHWSCSYCIASGVTGHKREARARRRATAAVRQMARLRAELAEENKSEGSNDGADKTTGAKKEKDAGSPTKVDGDEEKPKATEANAQSDEKQSRPTDSGDGTSTELEQENEASEAEKRNNKRKLDLFKISEKFSPSMRLENTNERRARRARRQPTLYDPQDCPASEWQSDGMVEWKTLGPTEKGIPPTPDEIAKREGPSGDGAEAPNMENKRVLLQREKAAGGDDRGEAPIWCNFCKDDPSIPVCCFCACRVCFGKHDGSKLLMCDNCDEEYHTYCLNPPLVAVPTSRKWYCPTCRSVLKRDKSETSQSMTTRGKSESSSKPPPSTPASPRRPSLRTKIPPREPVVQSPSSARRSRAVNERKAVSPPKEVKPAAPPLKRGPGRPRIRPLPDSTTPKKPTSTGRPRGRPPKRPRTPPRDSEAGDDKTQVKRPVKRALDPDLASGPERKRVKDGMPLTSRDVGGRPSSSSGHQEGPKPPARRGRPPNSEKRAALKAAEEKARLDSEKKSTDKSSLPVIQRSRSGRMVKRSTFHDEIEERERQSRALAKANLAQHKTKPSEQPPKATTPKPPVATHVQTASGFPVPKATTQPSAPTVTVVNPKQLPSLSKTLQGPTPSKTPQKLPALPTPQASQAQVRTDLKHVGKVDPSGVKAGASVDGKLASVAKPTGSGASAATPAVTAAMSVPTESSAVKAPRRKPGARECMQISRRFGAQVIPEKYMDILLDYCTRGKVEHLIRMRERLDDHSRFLESQLAGLEALVKEKGETDVVVPPVSVEKHDHASPPAAPIVRPTPPVVASMAPKQPKKEPPSS